MSLVCRKGGAAVQLLALGVAISCLLLGSGATAWGVEVLIDQGHGQRFVIEGDQPLGLSELAALFREQGARVRSSTAAFSDETLANRDILIVSGPFAPPSPAEIAAVTKFLQQGGKLVVMAHISQPLGQLLETLGVAISSLPVFEQEHLLAGQPRDFSVADLAKHPLLQGLTSFKVYGAWALQCREETVQELARTSGRAWLDLDRNGQPGGQEPVRAFPLVVSGRMGRGTFVVFSDDALFQNQFLEGGNLQLAKNLAAWLCRMGVDI